MKALVIYDSVFGNTEKVAQAIAAGLGARASAEILRPDQVTPKGFYVEDTEGPMKPGELERAAQWATNLLGTK